MNPVTPGQLSWAQRDLQRQRRRKEPHDILEPSHTHAYVAETLAGVSKVCRSELSMFFIVIESPEAYGCLLCGAARCENAATGAVRVFLAVGLS